MQYIKLIFLHKLQVVGLSDIEPFSLKQGLGFEPYKWKRRD